MCLLVILLYAHLLGICSTPLLKGLTDHVTGPVVDGLVTPVVNPVVNLTDKMVDSAASELCPVAHEGTCPSQYVKFWLYTRRNATCPVELYLSRICERVGWFENCNPMIVVVLVHGYQGSHHTQINRARPEYFRCGCYNIISVDWGALCKVQCYLQGVQNMAAVGRCISELVNELRCLFLYAIIHLVGYSLGARCCAIASYLCKVDVLHCIDSAYPLIPEKYLVPGNAGFVMYHHCTCGYLGETKCKGDVSVYWNSGVHQLTCGCNIVCSHNICIEYFLYSICSTPVFAYPCDRQKADEGKIVLDPWSLAVQVGEQHKNRCGCYFIPTTCAPPFLMKPSTFYNVSGTNATGIFAKNLNPNEVCPPEFAPSALKQLLDYLGLNDIL